MKKNFQIIVIVVCIILAVVGILVFSGAIPIGTTDTSTGGGTVVLWGTVPSKVMSPLIEEFNNANQSFVVKYVQKSTDTFDSDLLEALAEGTGPDMFFLSDNLAFHYSNKIFTIPYSTLPIATFQNTFASAGNVFLTSKGVLAVPLSIDPLVMYYNRSQLDANNIIYPPAYWDEFGKLIPTLTQKDNANRIIKSTLALGNFSNVTNAKDILAALFMQTGNPIVTESNGTFNSTLEGTNGVSNLGPVLKFYTDFADPNQAVYSWNKSFPNSSDAFSKEDVTFYFGFASELAPLINKNPNENFSLAPFPQIRGANFKLTDAHVMGIALLSSSKNFNTAFIASNLMAKGIFASEFATALRVAPARRDLLAATPSDSYSPTIYSSALYARSWLDPSLKDTNTIFSTMIEGVISNSSSIENAISDANSKLNLLLLR